MEFITKLRAKQQHHVAQDTPDPCKRQSLQLFMLNIMIPYLEKYPTNIQWQKHIIEFFEELYLDSKIRTLYDENDWQNWKQELLEFKQFLSSLEANES